MKMDTKVLGALLGANEFVVFDTETTSLKESTIFGKIIEIGAVKIVGGEITDTFAVFVNPEMKIPKKITELTHITDDMVKDAETIYPVIRKFKEFCGEAVLVAHNASFDMRFLKYFQNQICLPFSTDDVVLDTCKIDKVLFPTETCHKLSACCSRLGIEQEAAHRAVDDARVTALLFLKQREMVKKINTVSIPYSYKCSKKCVNVKDLKYRNFGDFKKEGDKKKSPIDRLYINLYYPNDNIYGTIFYDRTTKCWYNKNFPEGYELSFDEIEKDVLILRKGVL